MTKRLLHRIRYDSRGTSVIELAIAAPVLALLVAGVGDLGRGLSAKFALNQAIHRSLEKAVISNRRTDYSYLKAETATAAGVAEDNVVIDAWLECKPAATPPVRKTSFADTCAATEQVRRYVKVSVTSTFQPMFNYSFLQLGNANGTVPLQANASVRVQ